MTRQQDVVVAALALVLALAAPASAQQPADQRRVDSLAAEVRALKARLDSVRAQLAHRPAAAEPAADTSLAALRAAAAAAAGTDTSRIRGDTAGRATFGPMATRRGCSGTTSMRASSRWGSSRHSIPTRARRFS